MLLFILYILIYISVKLKKQQVLNQIILLLIIEKKKHINQKSS